MASSKPDEDTQNELSHMSINEQLAVKLFGWDCDADDPEAVSWIGPDGLYYDEPPDTQWDSSWSGAGEVIEAMRNQPFEVKERFDEMVNMVRAYNLTPRKIAKAAVEALEGS